MDLVTISQIANPILQTIFIAVIGLGYYFTVKATWATVQEMRAEHAAGGGRPLITVSGDYANLPNISLIVQNVGQGPAKDISFEFSAPVESSDGFVLSELPFFDLAGPRCQDRLLLGHPRQPPSAHQGREDSLRHRGDGALQGAQSQPLRAQLGDQPQAL